MPGSDDEAPDVIEMAPGFAGTPSVAGNLLYPAKDRKRRVVIAAAIGAVLVVAAVAAFAGLSPGAPSGASPVNPGLARLITQVTSVPESASDASGAVPFALAPAAVTGGPLTRNGKPEFFYVATEYCPYCAAENWAIIVALSRFGRFSGLSTIRSAVYPPFPPLDSWTFYGSSYASDYLVFVPVEMRSNILLSARANPLRGSSYRELQELTPAQQTIYDKYDTSRAVPFIDVDNHVVLVGSGFQPVLLEHLTWNQIAATLRHPGNPVGQGILSAASMITAAICQLTGDRPASACPPGIRSLQVQP